MSENSLDAQDDATTSPDSNVTKAANRVVEPPTGGTVRHLKESDLTEEERARLFACLDSPKGRSPYRTSQNWGPRKPAAKPGS